MIGIGFDGVLTDCDYTPGAEPVINAALVAMLAGAGVRRVSILANQGDLAFGVCNLLRKDGRAYPKPQDFLRRLHSARTALKAAGIDVAEVTVATYAHSALHSASIEAARILNLFAPCNLPFKAWSGADKRMPSPAMFHKLEIPLSAFYGCSDEEEQAARAAGVPFVRVERFDGLKVAA